MKHLVHPKFDALYKKYEKDTTISKTIPARTLIGDVLKERAETGLTYIMNIDPQTKKKFNLLIPYV